MFEYVFLFFLRTTAKEGDGGEKGRGSRSGKESH
jgi:hypothetical protein